MNDLVRLRGLSLGLCILGVLSMGCAGESAPAGGSGGEASVVVPEYLPSGEVPSEEEAMELVQQIEATVAVGNPNVFAEAMDWELVFDRTTAEIDAPEETETAFRTGLLEGVTGNGGLPAQVAQTAQQGGSYRLLQMREKDGELRALFRFLLPEAGVNYHDLLLVKGDDGRVRIGDIQVFLSAEDLSTTFRRFYVAMVAEQNRSFLEKLSGKNAAFAEHMGDVQAMSASIRSGQPGAALKTYKSLPEALQADKAVLLVRYQAAVEEGEAECIQAVRDFKRHHPNDACIDMLSLDLYSSTGEYDKVLECIDRVDESVGGDPYLNVLRAGALSAAKRFDEAMAAGKAAIEAEPDMIQAYWEVIAVALQKKDFAEVSRWLDQVAADFEVEFEDLKQIPEYAEYVKSPEYQKWLESQE